MVPIEHEALVIVVRGWIEHGALRGRVTVERRDGTLASSAWASSVELLEQVRRITDDWSADRRDARH